MTARSRKTVKADTHERKEKTSAPVYIHVDEFLTRKPELSPHDKAGFRVFMQGRSYQHSIEDFEKELTNFFNRDR
jgi:hypothetical protein